MKAPERKRLARLIPSLMESLGFKPISGLSLYHWEAPVPHFPGTMLRASVTIPENVRDLTWVFARFDRKDGRDYADLRSALPAFSVNPHTGKCNTISRAETVDAAIEDIRYHYDTILNVRPLEPTP